MLKRRLTALAVAMVAAFSCGIFAAGAAKQENEPEDNTYTAQDDAHYTLMDYQGTICVFQNGGMVLDAGISTEGLRGRDQELLLAGIETNSYEDVLRLLEDFSS